MNRRRSTASIGAALVSSAAIAALAVAALTDGDAGVTGGGGDATTSTTTSTTATATGGAPPAGVTGDATTSTTTSTGVSSGATPPGFRLDVVTLNGSGCPRGTASAAVSPHRGAVTITYSDYGVRLSGPVQENCTVAVRLALPPGWSMAVVGADFHGFRRMTSGTTGTLWVDHRFAGEPSVDRTYRLTGATAGDGENWVVRGTRDDAVWSPCGKDRLLIANSRLTIAGTGASGHITMRSTDVDFSTAFHLRWRRC